VFWYQYPAGAAPILISLFFFSSVQLFFIGIIGEYIGAIHTQVQKRPLVIEEERINFSGEDGPIAGRETTARSWRSPSTDPVERIEVSGVAADR
jgi:hypothetical protein